MASNPINIRCQNRFYAIYLYVFKSKQKVVQKITIPVQEESESDSENDETNQDEGYQEPGKPVILVDDDPNISNKQALKRRVSFAADVNSESQSSNEIR